MQIDPDHITPTLAMALLEWQLEMGADEPIGDVGVDRYALPEPVKPDRRRPQAAPAQTASVAEAKSDPVAVAQAAAGAAGSLEALARAIADYEHCDLKRGARNTVFADGNPAARVMVIGEAPGRDEDIEGRPFVGEAGQMLDRMFAAIGLTRTSPGRDSGLYITNVMPWRPPGNRDPDAAEIGMMRPFLKRHVELADPDILILMGNTPLEAVIGTRGILRLRGKWTQAWGKPVLPMTHPAYLLRNPLAKREAWADLLMLKEKLR